MAGEYDVAVVDRRPSRQRVAVLGLWVWRKGRPFCRATCSGPAASAAAIIVSHPGADHADSVVQYTPRWIGKQEQTIHMAHVASVRIDTGLLLSNVLIETSGGSDPIRATATGKRDAVRMKALIERYQTDHYRVPGGRPPGTP